MESGRTVVPKAGREVTDPGSPPGRMKVAFFSPETRNLKATELWCELPAAQGAGVGIDGTSFTAPLPGVVDRIWRLWSRRPVPGKVVWGLYWFLVFLPVRLYQVARLSRFDVVFVQRTMFRIKSPPVLEWVAIRIFRKPLVLHLDDPLWIRFPRKPIERRCRMATVVVTGSRATEEFVRSVGGTVMKVEYGLDTELYEVREQSGTAGLTIGFTGTGGDVYLEEVADALADVCHRTGSRFVYVGGPEPPSNPTLEPVMEWHPWDDDDPRGFLSKFDIAICPLIDDEWTRGKETFKVKEYMVAGLPIVLSPVGYSKEMVSDGVEGFFATGREEWFDRLMSLVGDPELRRRMGSAGRKKVEDRYDSRRMLEGIAAACREALASRSS